MSANAALAFLRETDVQTDRIDDDPVGRKLTADSRALPYMYWRKPDGRIVTGPSWPTEFTRQVEKGMTPLPKYGKFKEEEGDWNIHREPFRRILKLGGAEEFTVDQVLELGWHRKAPLKGITFPQLDGVDHTDVKCKYCGKPYLSEADLHKHESVMHKDVSAQSELARQLAAATTTATTASAGQIATPLAEVLKLLVERQNTLEDTIGAVLDRLAPAAPAAPGKKGREGA